MGKRKRGKRTRGKRTLKETVVAPDGLPNGPQLEALTRLTERRLRQLAKEGWFPTARRGVWNVADAVRGLFRYYQEGSSRLQDLKKDKLQESVKIEKAEAEIKVMQAAERRGDLMSTAKVQTLIRECFLPIRQRLLALPNEAASRCNPSDPEYARAALLEWVDRSLELIREALPKSA